MSIPFKSEFAKQLLSARHNDIKYKNDRSTKEDKKQNYKIIKISHITRKGCDSCAQNAKTTGTARAGANSRVGHASCPISMLFPVVCLTSSGIMHKVLFP